MQPNLPGKTVSTTYHALDIMRCVLAMLVVVIHSQPLRYIYPRVDFFVIEVLGRLAVPFFFLASGFFFFRKIDISRGDSLRGREEARRLRTYLVRLLKMYAIWAAIYLPLAIYLMGKYSDTNPMQQFLYLLRNTVFTGTMSHLWYFTALMFSVLAIHILLRYVRIHTIIAISLVLYVVGMFGLAYSVFIENETVRWVYDKNGLLFGGTRNGLFFGMLFVAVGAKLSRMNTARLRPAVIVPLLAVLLGVMGYEVSALKAAGWNEGFDTYISLVPAAILLFVLFLNVGRGGGDRPIYLYLRNASLLIYVSHIAFLYIVPKVFGLEEQEKLPTFLIATACTLALTFGVIWLSRKYKALAFLKHFYG